MTLVVPAKHQLRRLLELAKWIFTPLALIFFLAAVWQSRTIIRDTLEHSLLLYFIFAVLSWMAAYFLSPLFGRIVLNASGAEVRYWQILDLHLRYLPARYIPGGVWHTVARVSSLHHLGVRPMSLNSFVIFENVVALCVSLLAGGLLVGFYQYGTPWQPIAYLSVVSSLIMLVLCPILVNRLLLKSVGNIGYRTYIAGVLVAIIFWGFASTSFLLYISALPNGFSIGNWLEIVGAYLFSWGMGFIAIFAPQGVGIFEVVAADIMPTDLPFNALVALLAGFRLVVVVADILSWLGWAVWTYTQNFIQLKKTRHS